jgi:hypothetical protein
MAARRSNNGVDDSYDAWAHSNPRPLVELEVEEGTTVVRRPGRYPGRGRRPAAPRLIVHDGKAEALDEPEYNVDEQLDRLTRKVIMRLHQEIQNYSVPQLLSGLHKCLQVRVLLQTLRLKGGGDTHVGAAVRKYSSAFTQADVGDNRQRGRRPAASDNDEFAALDYLTDED